VKIRQEANAHSTIMHTLHMLTDVHGPRVTGSPSLKAAGEWAIKEMASWGFANGHLEPWTSAHPGWVNERFHRPHISPVKDQLTAEVLAWTPGTDGTVTAQAYQLMMPDRPTPISSPRFSTQQGQVRGRIVLAGKHTIVPVEINPPAKRRPDDQVRTQYDPNNRIRAAAGRGGGRGDQPAPPMTTRQIDAVVDPFLVANGASCA